MSTFADLAADSLSDLGQLGIGQSASPEQLAQAMRYANRWLDKLSIQRLMLFTVGTTPYVLTPALQDYTIGPSAAGAGSFVQARPTFIESAQIQLPGSAMTEPLNLLDRTKWGAIRDKGAICSALGLPQDIWVEYAYPNLAFHMWTIPSNACIVNLAAWVELQQFQTIFDQLNLPPGYETAIQKNLSVELAPAYDMAPSPALLQSAADGLVQIQKINAQSLGGALGESQTLQNPNQVVPPPSGGPQ